HLAGQEVRDIQLAQTQELLTLLGSDPRPTILVGDFNSDAFGADPTRVTPTYGLVRADGYQDTWVEPDRKAPGLTCCERSDLLNPRPTFDQRIDFVFAQNLPADVVLIHREVVGDRPGDRTSAGVWPSDHGGAGVEVCGEARRKGTPLPRGEPGQRGGMAGALDPEAREQPMGDRFGVGGYAEAPAHALRSALPVAQRGQPGRACQQDPLVPLPCG